MTWSMTNTAMMTNQAVLPLVRNLFILLSCAIYALFHISTSYKLALVARARLFSSLFFSAIFSFDTQRRVGHGT